MDRITIDLLDDGDDDILTTLSPWELSLTADLAAEKDQDYDDELGLRRLYEEPEALLGPGGWPDKA